MLNPSHPTAPHTEGTNITPSDCQISAESGIRVHAYYHIVTSSMCALVVWRVGMQYRTAPSSPCQQSATLTSRGTPTIGMMPMGNSASPRDLHLDCKLLINNHNTAGTSMAQMHSLTHVLRSTMGPQLLRL